MTERSYISAKRGPLGAMRVEIHSGPDDLGRCRYAEFWMQNCDADVSAGIPAGIRERAQEFFAVPPQPECRIRLTAKEHGLLVMDVLDVGVVAETEDIASDLRAGRSLSVTPAVLNELVEFADRDDDPRERAAYRRLYKKARTAMAWTLAGAGVQT